MIHCFPRIPRGILTVGFVLGIMGAMGNGAESVEGPLGERLSAAKRYVETSDRYLHHSNLRRGMKGHGLTVLSGTEIVRFDVDIVSVMTKWGPHQDVIFAKLSGCGLEKTGVIQGMSGSPCYVRHDGREKMIGAVAYAWSAQKEAQCGIQPITQMLAIAGIGTPAPTQPATRPQSRPETLASEQRIAPTDLVADVLDPRKLDFARISLPRGLRRSQTSPSQLIPLGIPLMVSSASGRAMQFLTEALGPVGIVPVQGGGLAPARGQIVRDAKLAPGSAMSLPMVTGDANYSALGTVTDVIGDRVLAFGHGLYGDGEVSLPMGPGYVNTVVSSLFASFKVSSDLKITGVLDRDEMVGVSGRIGRPPAMVPMSVKVRWEDMPGREGYTQSYSYEIVQHRWMTALMVSVLASDVVWEWRTPPREHTVAYKVTVEFEDLGKYETENVISDRFAFPAVSDATRPIVALLNNPYGKRPKVERVALELIIRKGTRSAKIIQLRVAGRIYRPGETVTGKLTVEPYRRPRTEIPIRFKLPRDLPDGEYALTVCDYVDAVLALQKEMPQRFSPRTVGQLFESMKRVVGTRADRLYLRLPLDSSGLALGDRELPDLPESKTRILKQADLPDTEAFARSIVRELTSDYVLNGSSTVELVVQKRPTETLIRREKE